MKLLANKKKSPKLVLLPLMQKLREADQAVRKFQSENERIFTAFHHLKEARDVAENEVKTAAKQLGAGYEADDMVCEYVMPKHRWYSPEILRAHVSEKILNALDVIQRQEVVDETVLKALVKAGKIKKSVLKLAFCEEPTGSPRVTITFKEPSS